MTKQWKKMATVGAVFGDNLYSSGTTNFTAAQLKNANQAWNDVVSGGGKPADNATIGAVFGTNLYKTGTTNFTAAELKNANQDWQDVSGSGIPADSATVGSTVGTNFYKSGTTTNYGVAEFQNNQIGLHSSGYLTNIGTTEKLKNALVTANTDGTLNYAGSGSGNPTMNTLTDAGNIRSRVTTGLTAAGVVDEAVPTLKGGTGETATNKFLNSGITIDQGASGVFTLTRGDGGTNTTTISKSLLGLSYTDGATVGATWGTDVGSRPTELTDGRVSTGLTSSGILDTTVPVLKGGTNQTATNKFLNSDLGIALDGTTLTLTKAGDTNSTYSVPNALKNAQVSINANGTLTGAGGGTPSLASITGIVPKTGGGFGETVADKTGAISFSSGTISYGTLPVGVGGTGLTSTTTFENTNVTTFERNVSDIFWTNISGQMSPTATSYPITITWRNGAGTSLGTTVITVSLFSSTVLAAAVTTSNGASATISLGAQSNTNVLQSTTVTKNSIVCNVRAQIIDGSGWNFK